MQNRKVKVQNLENKQSPRKEIKREKVHEWPLSPDMINFIKFRRRWQWHIGIDDSLIYNLLICYQGKHRRRNKIYAKIEILELIELDINTGKLFMLKSKQNFDIHNYNWSVKQVIA